MRGDAREARQRTVGRDEKEAAGRAAVAEMTAEIQRLGALPLRQLAVEIMVKGFGPGGPGGPGLPDSPGSLEVPATPAAPWKRVTNFTIAALFVSGFESKAVSPQLRWPLRFLVREGLQVLEHACLVLLVWDPGEHYAATRLGRRALASGTVEHYLSADI
jgi:hypothetical protein